MAGRQISEESTIVASRKVPFTQVQDEMLGIDYNQGYCYGLNSSGARIWQLIQTPISVAELVRRLAGEFDVDSNLCQRQALEFLDQLADSGLAEFAVARTSGAAQ